MTFRLTQTFIALERNHICNFDLIHGQFCPKIYKYYHKLLFDIHIYDETSNFSAVSLPRQSLGGEYLPSAREVSMSVHTDSDRPHTHVTTILAIFGEFVYHDLAHIAQSAGKKHLIYFLTKRTFR